MICHVSLVILWIDKVSSCSTEQCLRFWTQPQCAGGVILTSCSSTCMCALARVSYISFMVLSFPIPCSFPWHALALSPHIPFLLTLSLPVCCPHPFIPISILCSLLLCFHRDGSLSFWVQDTESPKDLLHYYFPRLFFIPLSIYISVLALFSLFFYLPQDYLFSSPPLS